MIDPRKENDHLLHEPSNGTLSEVDSSENGESVCVLSETPELP